VRPPLLASPKANREVREASRGGRTDYYT